MSDNTPLGDRMKRYERIYRPVLPRRAYTLLRLDGRAFHTYLRNAAKPYDRIFASEMAVVAQWLCVDIQGAQFAYTQSDEISILVTDFDTIQSEPWVGGRLDKTVSLAAGFASAYLSRLRQNHQGLAVFDCRAQSMSDPVEVANYFVWRQRDAVTNSIQMHGQHHFTQEQLHGKSCNQIQEMLWSQAGLNWDKLDPGVKRGQLIARVPDEGWAIRAAPIFVAAPGSELSELIPELPTLRK